MIELNRLLKVIPFHRGATAEFQRMLGWKLLRGSHEFPGPDGGTCINEAAIVAAGYSYRAVHSIDDCPASFSRPIAMFALCLNDLLEDAPRQELLIPFVARLDGTADTAKVEAARADMMLRRTAADILAPALMRAGFDDLARQCRALAKPDELIEVARCLRSRTAPGVHLLLVAACDSAADAARQSEVDAAFQSARGWPSEVVRCLAHVIGDVAAVNADAAAPAARDRATAKIFRQAAAILDAALKIGNKADAVGARAVIRRMDAAKRAPVKDDRGRNPVLVSEQL
jgi:hypothetical protein